MSDPENFNYDSKDYIKMKQSDPRIIAQEKLIDDLKRELTLQWNNQQGRIDALKVIENRFEGVIGRQQNKLTTLTTKLKAVEEIAAELRSHCNGLSALGTVTHVVPACEKIKAISTRTIGTDGEVK